MLIAEKESLLCGERTQLIRGRLPETPSVQGEEVYRDQFRFGTDYSGAPRPGSQNQRGEYQNVSVYHPLEAPETPLPNEAPICCSATLTIVT
jgi:hypothetical protein